VKHFPPFRFDSSSGLLWHSSRQVPLTRKAALLLDCLVSRPGVLVPHDVIMRVVWPDAHVQHENVKVLVHELRVAMNDSAHLPLFIRSSPGRGYTFLASVTDAPPPFGSSSADAHAPALVGRDVEVRAMLSHLAAAIETGHSQIVLIEGERGIGKTSLCNAFVAQATTQNVIRVSRAEGHESADVDGSSPLVVDALNLLADQYPLLVPPAVLERLHAPQDRFARLSLLGLNGTPESQGVPRVTARTGGEIAALFETLTRDMPLLLILEDLQWTDKTTLTFLEAVARRQPGSSLCIVSTYRRTARVEAGEALERLGREVKAQRRGAVIRLTGLSRDHVKSWVSQAVGKRAAAATAAAVFDATGGHPALVARAIAALHDMALDEWTGDHLSLAVSTMVAEGVQYQIDQLESDDRIVLETAAVIGPAFSAAEVAAALDLRHATPIVRHLDGLAAHGTLIEADSSRSNPDSDARYRFRASATVDLLVGPIPISRCARISAKARHATRLSSARPN